jgi:two-component system NtrC family sensor kinase
VRFGIRLQIVFSLGLVLAIAFVPLYLGVASLTRASLAASRREAARDWARAIAAPLLAARGEPREALEVRAERQLSDGAVLAIGLYGLAGSIAGAGDRSLLPPTASPNDAMTVVTSSRIPGGTATRVSVPGPAGTVAVVALAIDPRSAIESPLVDLVAVSLGVLAIVLLSLANYAMQRLVVRPVDALALAAEKVAAGARELPIPTGGARELETLGMSLRAMTDKLVASEREAKAQLDRAKEKKLELENAQASLVRSEKLASVGRLAAGMAHEIGNPLAALLGFEELLLSGDIEPEEQRDFLRRMKRETERIHGVLRDLLDFARPREALGEGASAAHVEPVVDAVLGLLAPQKGMRGVEVMRAIEPNLPAIALSEERLEQVLLNLVLNASDAVDGEGGRVELRARRDGDAIVLEVDDNGPGIAPSVRDRLFEPFVTTKEPGKGTGLGLAVGRGLVEAAGGTIAAREGSLGGACFEVRLPIAS